MSEPITPREYRQLPAGLRLDVHNALDRALVLLTNELYGTVASSADLDEHPAAARRDHHLARLAAVDLLTEELGHWSEETAYAAGQVEAAPATYAELGRAVGLSREGARNRWPGAVKDARPGRPRTATLEVHLDGGPPTWAGSMQTYPRDEVMRGPLEDVGAYLTTPGDEWPEDLPAGPDWRAHYAPESEHIRTTWVFQGWVES